MSSFSRRDLFVILFSRTSFHLPFVPVIAPIHLFQHKLRRFWLSYCQSLSVTCVHVKKRVRSQHITNYSTPPLFIPLMDFYLGDGGDLRRLSLKNQKCPRFALKKVSVLRRIVSKISKNKPAFSLPVASHYHFPLSFPEDRANLFFKKDPESSIVQLR